MEASTRTLTNYLLLLQNMSEPFLTNEDPERSSAVL